MSIFGPRNVGGSTDQRRRTEDLEAALEQFRLIEADLADESRAAEKIGDR
jgi:hypothetical protein